MIRRIYKTELKDKEILVEQALVFARENHYREALVKSERAVSAGMYDEVLKPFEAARLVDGRHSTKTGEAKLPVYLLHQLLSAEFESEGNYLVDTIVPRGGAIMSYGLPKGLKSWLSTAVALDAAIGDGKAVCYFDVPRPVKVLLVQVEDPASRTQSRLQRLREARPFRQNPYPGNLRIITRCPLNLLDSSWVAELEAVIKKQRTELIIFDVFRRLFRGNVNSPEDTAAFLEVVIVCGTNMD